MIRTPKPVRCGYFNPQRDVELMQFFGALAEAHQHPVGAAPPHTVPSLQTLCPDSTQRLTSHFPSFSPRPSTLRVFSPIRRYAGLGI